MKWTQVALLRCRHVRSSRAHAPLLLVGIVGLTLLLSTHHRTVNPKPLVATDDDDRITGQQENNSTTATQTTNKLTRTERKTTTTTGVTLSTREPASTDSKSFSRQIVRQIIQSQGTFIPIETNRTSSGSPPVSPEDIRDTLEILDKQIEVSKKLLAAFSRRGPADYWNTTYPKQLLIVTSWRSGSTFLGEILANHPAVFHHYEPLSYFGANQIRGGKEGVDAVGHLRGLFQCNYSHPEYLMTLRNRSEDMLSHNVQLWNTCRQSPHRNTCKSAAFLHQACQRFPVILAKTVRLRLALIRSLLVDPDLERLKIIYLIRDPRATMNSRFQVGKWCTLANDCINPERLCTDVLGDLETFEMLTVAYPARLALVKYETLASEPHDTFQEIFRFLDLPFLPSVNATLRKHTTHNENESWSTYRQSTERIDRWKFDMNRTQVDQVQKYCSTVLERLGYPLV